MLKISRSFGEIEKNILLSFCDDCKIEGDKTLKTHVSKLNLVKNEDDVVAIESDFERICKLDVLNLGRKEPVLETKVVEEEAVVPETIETSKEKEIINQKCLNFNQSCSRCKEKFKNDENYHQIIGEEIMLDSKCFKCHSCDERIEDGHYIAGEKLELYHPVCYYNEHFNQTSHIAKYILCYRCRSEINDDVYLILDKLSYHLNCVKCHHCNEMFSKETLVSKYSTQFYCSKCIPEKSK